MIEKWSFEALDLRDILERVETFSELGRKYRNNLKPWLPGQEDDLNNYFHLIAEVIDKTEENYVLQDRLKAELYHLKDISYSVNRLGKDIQIHELFEIKQFCYFYERLRLHLAKNNFKLVELFPHLRRVFTILDPEEQEVPTFKISSSYSAELAHVRESIASLSRKKKINQQLFRQKIMDQLNLSKIEEKFIVSNMNHDLKAKVDESSYFGVQEENFANTIYYLKYPDEIKDYEYKLNKLFIKQEELSSEVIFSLSQELQKYQGILIQAHEIVAKFDDMLGKAIFSLKYDCTIPTLLTEYKVEIVQAVNIPVYDALKRVAIAYQKIDLMLDNKMNILVGANMAGKSTALNTLGQFAYLAQHGFPLPAHKCAIPLFDYILVTGDEANQKSIDLSSFGKEMVRINSYYSRKGKGLFILDEFARGTNPKEGNALSKALFESLKSKNNFSFCATHFNSPLEITGVAHYTIPGITEEDYLEIKNQNQINPDNRLKALHKRMKYNLVRISGQTETPQAGLMIAELLGTDEEIINKAKEYLHTN
jgi:dsDNA-specific endonuclease/ATPase MutS2